ncbi:Flp pilus assembly complex ATPase component TadA [Candidatus Uhrbacteria bacterium]|nr:Flp pilus assembly complex ATPase component TadA [Candidatus Uhrbacteria bacterium]
MFISNEKLKKILLKAEMLDEDTWADIVKNAERLKSPVEDILRERDVIGGHFLYELIEKEVRLPYVNLKKIVLHDDVLDRFDPATVSTAKAIPYEFDKKKKTLKVAFLDPTNAALIRTLEKKYKVKILPAFTGKESYRFASKHYQTSVANRIRKVIAKIAKTTSKKTQSQAARKIFDSIVEYIYYTQPSDVHIEHLTDEGVIKLRVDGFLRDEISLPASLATEILNLIKYESSLKTDAHRQTADGRFAWNVFGEILAFRVSILPTYYGEKACLRVLDESRQKASMRELGFQEVDVGTIKKEIKRPYGLILVAGPTGSGKTSTLYALLKLLNVEGVSIATIEDPVEYSIRHINQTQVDAENGFTFAKGLREILRQDPNVIMVGEIRDNETAGIVIQSALTGHIVISTLHSNTAIESITRLRNMDIRPYLLAPTMNLVISQRLVKRICPYCRESFALDNAFLDSIDKDTGIRASLDKLKKLGLLTFQADDDVRFFRGKGCSKCSGKGMSGRVGIFEIFNVSEDIQKMILEDKPARDIQKYAESKGMLTLFEDGLTKVLAGETTIGEIMRILS